VVGVGVRAPGYTTARLRALVDWLRRQPWCGPVFVRDDRWAPAIDGALPISVLWDGAVGRWVPEVQFSCAWDDEPNDRGVPGHAWSVGSGVALTNHGSLSPRDMSNLMVLTGPGVKAGFATAAPAALVDLAPTILHLLGLAPGVEMQGRVLHEAFEGGAEPTVTSTTLADGPWGRLGRREAGGTGYVRVER
jgi:hypothetical protein